MKKKEFEQPITTEEVIKRTGFSRQKMWRLQKSETPFPKPFGKNKWLWSEIIAWQDAIKAKRDVSGIDDIKRNLSRQADLILIEHLTKQVAEIRLRLAGY